MTLAWAYVGLRVIHSLIQATVNIILWRFAVFALGSVVLFLLAPIQEVMGLIQYYQEQD